MELMSDEDVQVLDENEPSVEDEPCEGENDEPVDLGSLRGKRKVTSILSSIAGMIIPALTMQRGKEKITLRRRTMILLSLYMSHSFSAWVIGVILMGDRMWGFAVALLLALLYPGSLLLPGIHGLMVQFTVAIFGAVIGDWVDFNSRIKVAAMSLVVQNGLLSLSSVGMALMFYYEWNVCLDPVVFSILTVFVILLASGANLATVANTISIEKDWIVVIADGNEDILAVLNANMRRIDLCCKLLAPALTGVILQHSGPFTTTVIVAFWNFLSFFGEFGLLWIVYKSIPGLAIKKIRNSVVRVVEMTEEIEGEDNSKEEDIFEDDGLIGKDDKKNLAKTQQRKSARYCLKLFSLFSTIKGGWRIYIRQEIALVGFSLASIYLTVLGFSGVTSSYFLTQGLRFDLIGVLQGVGAIFGVSGTIVYPLLRKKFGTIRTGLFGISTQLLILSFSVAAIIVPSNRVSSEATGYYSPKCNETVIEINTSISTLMPFDVYPTPTIRASDSSVVPSVSLMPSIAQNVTSQSNSAGNNIALILMLIGVVGCRVGLWIFDLAVQQLVQEKVVEEERGVVSGVMNAMISIMDMLHYVLVIAAPRPEHFTALTAISFSMVFLGWLLYSIYVRKARGHFFHFNDFCNYFRKRKQARQVLSDTET